MAKTLYTIGGYTPQGDMIANKSNFISPWEEVYSKQGNDTIEFVTRSLPNETDKTGTQIGYVKAVEGTVNRPLIASMDFTSHDLYKARVRVGDTPSGQWDIYSKFEDGRGWDSKTPVGYVSDSKKENDTYDLGHLLFHQITGVNADRSWNQVAENSKLNREGAIYKAEELARMFSRAYGDDDIKYTVVPDWENTIPVGVVLRGQTDEEGRPKMAKWMAPKNLLVQIHGRHGSSTFFIPNSSEAMQEPTRYMVNRKWVEKNFPVAKGDITNRMPEEDGYKQQMTGFFKNIAGDAAKNMPLMDAVKKAYMASPIFRKQIEQAGRK